MLLRPANEPSRVTRLTSGVRNLSGNSDPLDPISEAHRTDLANLLAAVYQEKITAANCEALLTKVHAALAPDSETEKADSCADLRELFSEELAQLLSLHMSQHPASSTNNELLQKLFASEVISEKNVVFFLEQK